MSDARKAERGLSCPRCKAGDMDELLSIAPSLNDKGLVAYECPSCGCVTSVLVEPAEHNSGSASMIGTSVR